ncbi:hypothetical protein [Dysgonomonas sp. 25]|uniref:hypothetical protein n=1 Tax=Dysgonomonas sp. 25 TaxID=2302933 RepID=UPI0013D5EAC8|nr:hypothetical protein [Dysgonomonas sp. 25]NDV68382.1 hypothetical protein [Dysgonomonas sp. 25]
MLKIKKFTLLALLVFFAGSLAAQMTNSPYSRYGYGVLKDQTVGPSKGMGGIGYGLRHKQGANPLNPASYTSVDSLTFMLDMSVNYTSSKLTENGANQTDDNGGLDYLTMLFPVTKNMAVSVGAVPVSSVGYSFGSIESAGGVSYKKTFDGTGGLSQVYGGLGYQTPLKGLSVGANVSYLFGKMEHKRSLPSISVPSNTSSEVVKLKVRTAKFDIGAQYQFDISPKNTLILGAVFSPKINSKGDYEDLTINYDASGNVESYDGDTVKNVPTGMPATFGLGFTLVHDQRLTFGADVTFQQWENVKYTEKMGDGLPSDSKERFNNRVKIAAGVEYAIAPRERDFFKRMRFRGGFNYANSYMNVAHTDAGGVTHYKGFDEYGATLGVGIPIKEGELYGGRTSYINVTFEYKRLEPKMKAMIKEEYYGVSVGINFNEVWFWKNKLR